MCGEYGEKTLRPHYHALLFGVRFEDAEFFCERKGNRVYKSEILDRLWGLGHTEIGSVTKDSAGYVARYTLAKQEFDPDDPKKHLLRADEETGEAYYVNEAYNRSSNRPGIGYYWYQRYKDDVFPEDCITLEGGRTVPTPSYYRALLERDDPELAAELRQRRVENATNNPDNTDDRLTVREICRTSKTNRLKREYL